MKEPLCTQIDDIVRIIGSVHRYVCSWMVCRLQMVTIFLKKSPNAHFLLVIRKLQIVRSSLHIYPCSPIKGDTNLTLVGNNIDVVTNIP